MELVIAVDVYSWAVVAFEIWSLRGKPFSTYSLEAHADKVVVAGERPRLPVAWSDDIKDLLGYAWRGDPQQRCSAGHAAGVLTRLEVSGGPDPLAANMACCVIA